ncbi:MAG TPA: redoxin domain-containing protein [Candidatus Paceibacterota bacterium]|jgi:thiol-disulfide isomerase/thioredoxin|nr:redoxin domain-containing protein [Candidatus Paceibacterota bacterium]
MKRKNIILIIVLIGIVATILFINAKKPVRIDSSTAPDVTVTPTSSNDRTAVLAKKAAHYSKAKEFIAPSGFINTAPFKLSDLVGKKVVLIDFWTYSCINCQRTIPYLNAWYQKYKDSGLVIVGVHTPEFDFEKDKSNVVAAVQKAGIQYPVVMDNNMGTWNAYSNQYWPHEYLIDIDGYVVHDHIGEGDYAATEKVIQSALQERNTVLGLTAPIPTGTVDPSNAIALNDNGVQSPETYFGAERNEYLGNGVQGKIENQTLTIPSATQNNTLYLDGTWNFQYQYAETVSPISHIQYSYNAKHVYMVASAKSPVTLKLTLDGKPYKTITVQANQLYDLVDGSSYGAHILQIEVDGAGLDAYTFTFG